MYCFRSCGCVFILLLLFHVFCGRFYVDFSSGEETPGVSEKQSSVVILSKSNVRMVLNRIVMAFAENHSGICYNLTYTLG